VFIIDMANKILSPIYLSLSLSLSCTR